MWMWSVGHLTFYVDAALHHADSVKEVAAKNLAARLAERRVTNNPIPKERKLAIICLVDELVNQDQVPHSNLVPNSVRKGEAQ